VRANTFARCASLFPLILFLLVVGTSGGCQALSQPESWEGEPIEFKVANFVGDDSARPYKVYWSGSGHPWRYEDATYFTPTFELRRPAPYLIIFTITVRDQDTGGGASNDEVLGTLKVKIQQGQTKPDLNDRYSIVYEADAVAQGRGFPAGTYGKFWLVCTSNGHLRGGDGPDDDDDAENGSEIYFRARHWDSAVQGWQFTGLDSGDLGGQHQVKSWIHH
jgi:hypothetical protein